MRLNELKLQLNELKRKKMESEMKKFFEVTFEHLEGAFCSNIAHAKTLEDVRKYYDKYKWSYIKIAD